MSRCRYSDSLGYGLTWRRNTCMRCFGVKMLQLILTDSGNSTANVVLPCLNLKTSYISSSLSSHQVGVLQFGDPDRDCICCNSPTCLHAGNPNATFKRDKLLRLMSVTQSIATCRTLLQRLSFLHVNKLGCNSICGTSQDLKIAMHPPICLRVNLKCCLS